MTFLNTISAYIWGKPTVFLLLGVGFLLTLRLFLIQIRYLYLGFRLTFGSESKNELKDKGELSHFQALTTSLSATIGVGNIVGVAGAILIGGPGAVFWMWVSGFLGMSTKYAECFLALKYRESTPSGFSGGPMYYIEKGLKLKWLAIFFTIATLVAGLGIGNMTQANSAVGELYSSNWKVPREISAALISIVTGLVILGGIRRIGKVTSILVPFMGIFYFVASLYIIIQNHESIAQIFSIIFKFAFEPLPALTGSAVGFWQASIMVGIRRGLFSNEAGLGSAPMAAASARTADPGKQGLVSMVGPFLDTIIICTLTAFVILIGIQENANSILSEAVTSKLPATKEMQSLFSHAFTNISGDSSLVWSQIINQWGVQAEKIQDVLVSSVFFHYLGTLGRNIVTWGILLFSISTIIGWFHYTDRALVYLGLQKYSFYYRIIWVSLTFIGGYTSDIHLIWVFSDIANGFMALPNLLALLLLSPIVVKETKSFLSQYSHRFDLFANIYLLYLRALPKHWISRFFGYFACFEFPKFLMSPILKIFSRAYQIKLDEAEFQLREYPSLNQFFIRNLKKGMRKIHQGERVIVSPVDGRILNFGEILQGAMIQVKGIPLNLRDILSNHTLYPKFRQGIWMTIYLAPHDYHKIHSPVEGDIIGHSYSPGRLLPVNDFAVNAVKNLFSKNERLTTYIKTEHGLVALTKVGATNVGKIKLVYDDSVSTNSWFRSPSELNYGKVLAIKKGEELARFEMGSTVILFFETNRAQFDKLREKQIVKLGQKIGSFIS